MSIPAPIIASSSSSSSSIAVIGVGGGNLCMLLNDLFPSISITGVELDPLVVEIAKKYFGLKTNEKLKVIVKDGLEFLNEKSKYDIIMYDVDNKEQGSALSCPPLQFLESSILKNVADSLGNEGTKINKLFFFFEIQISFHLISSFFVLFQGYL